MKGAFKLQREGQNIKIAILKTGYRTDMSEVSDLLALRLLPGRACRSISIKSRIRESRLLDAYDYVVEVDFADLFQLKDTHWSKKATSYLQAILQVFYDSLISSKNVKMAVAAALTKEEWIFLSAVVFAKLKNMNNTELLHHIVTRFEDEFTSIEVLSDRNSSIGDEDEKFLTP
jgi:hypothetical protein